jgi:hypothetical protein
VWRSPEKLWRLGGVKNEKRKSRAGVVRMHFAQGCRRLAFIGFAVTVAAVAAVPSASAQDDAEQRRVFEQILQDPGNPGLNLRYARLAIERGEIRKALAAYERILAQDPNNEEAKAGIRRIMRELEPSVTRVTLLLGGQYESNPHRSSGSTANRHDGALSARLLATHERRIGAMRWRAEGDVYANYHTRFHDIDFGIAGGRAGPVFDLGEGLRLHAFIGGSYSWLTQRTFYTEGTAGATLEIEGETPLKSVSVRWGYQFVGEDFSTRDGTFVEISPRFVVNALLVERSIAVITPYWRYNGVFGSGPPGVDPRSEPFPARYHQLGIRSDYFVPIFANLTLGVGMIYEYRHYFESVTDKSKNRRDHVLSPSAQLIVAGLANGKADLIFSYSFEHRASNDRPQLYDNHTAGAKILWRF